MIELQWLRKSTGERVMNKWGFYEDGVETVLQYRQIINHTHWSDWQQVPTVDEHSADRSKYYTTDKE